MAEKDEEDEVKRLLNAANLLSWAKQQKLANLLIEQVYHKLEEDDLKNEEKKKEKKNV